MLLLSIIDKLQYKLYYRIPFPFSPQLLNRRKKFGEHNKISRKKLGKKKACKIEKRDGSSEHRTEDTTIREFKNHKNK